MIPLHVVPPNTSGLALTGSLPCLLPVNISDFNFYVSITNYIYFSAIFFLAKPTTCKARKKLEFVSSECKSASFQNQKGSSIAKGLVFLSLFYFSVRV